MKNEADQPVFFYPFLSISALFTITNSAFKLCDGATSGLHLLKNGIFNPPYVAYVLASDVLSSGDSILIKMFITIPQSVTSSHLHRCKASLAELTYFSSVIHVGEKTDLLKEIWKQALSHVKPKIRFL